MATAADKTPAPTDALTAPTEAADIQFQPPGLLTTKAEPSQSSRQDIPVVVDTILLGPDSKVEKFSDGKIYVTTSGTQEIISQMPYQTFLKQNMKRVASSSIPTGLASQMEEDESEPIDWGDMDPSFARMLQSTPSMLQAYKALRSPKKMAKLDTVLGSVQPSTNVALPEPSPTVTLPDSVTLENIKDTIQNYRDTTVQPSFEIPFPFPNAATVV